MSFSLSGIASGLDTNTIISQLMEIERIPYNKLQNRQKSYSNEQSIFRNINTKLAALRTAADDLKLAANFNLRSAVVSDESVLKVTATESAAEGSYNIEVKQLATYSSIKSKAFDKGESESGPTLSGTIRIWNNGEHQDFKLSETATSDEEVLKDLVDQINKANFGVQASLIETEPGKISFVLASVQSGEANKINTGIGNSQGIHIAAVNVIDEDTIEEDTALSSLLDFSEGQKAQNALLVINGIEVVSSSNELTNVISGVTLNLSKIGNSTVQVSRDLDKIAEKVETFVKAYNDVVNVIRTNTAKGASLQGDATLRSLQDQLHNLFNSAVGSEGNEDGAYRYLFEIGLEIDKGVLSGSAMTGTISFDKEKFKKALAENPDGVYQLFAYSEGDEGNNANSGIAVKFSDSLRMWTRSGSGIIAAKIDGYDEQIKYLSKQMEHMETRLFMREEQLKKQFNAMEVALASLQSQMTWLNSQILAMNMNGSNQ